METNKKNAARDLDTTKSWLVVFSGALLFFYSFLQLNILNPITDLLMKDFKLDPSGIGWLSSMYFFANFVFLFPAGLILDRLSCKKWIMIAMAFAVISMFGFAFSYNVPSAGIFRFFSGVGGAFSFIGAVRLASRWFSPKKMALGIGCLVTLGMLGGAAAQTPAVFLTESLGWRNMMVIFGVLGIFLYIWMLIFVKDFPEHLEEKDAARKIKRAGFWKSVSLALKNRYNWFGGLYTAFLNLPIFILGALWGNIYLTQGHGIDKEKASYVISFLFIGSIAGAPIIGWFSDYIKKRKFPMVLGAGLSLIIILAIIYIPFHSVFSLSALFFMLGFFTSSQALSYPAISELNSPLVTAAASSIISSVLIGSGFIFQPLFGWLMQMASKRKTVYSLQDFYVAMIILPAVFLLGLIFALLIKETNCKRQKK